LGLWYRCAGHWGIAGRELGIELATDCLQLTLLELGDFDRRSGNRVCIRFGQDPGQPGKSQPLHLVRALQAEQRRAEKGSS